jgi:hypothetical protein
MSYIDKVSVAGTSYDLRDSVLTDGTPNLTDAQKATARLNIDAVSPFASPFGNVLAPVQISNGTDYHSNVARRVTVRGNAVTYAADNSTNSTFSAYPITGTNIRALAMDSSSNISGTLSADDFVTLPVAVNADTAGHIYLWLYSPDNAAMFTSIATNTDWQIYLATKPTEGDIYIAKSKLVDTAYDHQPGMVIIDLMAYWPTTMAQMLANKNIAVYIGTKKNNTGLNGTFCWGISVETDHSPVTVSGSTPTITAASGKQYVCSASSVSTLSFTPSASGLCSVRFKSGTTPTVLTLPNTVKMPSWWTGVEANKTYEIMVSDGVYGAVMSWT